MQKQCVPDSLLSAHTQQPKKVCRVLPVWTGPTGVDAVVCVCAPFSVHCFSEWVQFSMFFGV